MLRGSAHRHSIFCIIPPYVLEQMAENGTEELRRIALRTLTADNTLRLMRANLALAGFVRRPAPNAGEAAKHRAIYDAQHTQNLPGGLVRAEGSAATGDVAVDEAYDGLGHTFDFYWDVYERNSIDAEGMPLDATVHFGQSYNNAFWNSERMVFGDGDGRIFNRFTISLDVIGHELTHGVTEDEAGLLYSFQSGAMNESLSDVFGSLIKQRINRQTADQADWLIGAGLFTSQVKGVALRSMKAPGTAFDDPVLGKDPQPAHMDAYVNTYADNGGVHINSGIPNHAFYQVAVMLGGYAWEKAGRIWYEALRDSRLRPGSNFRAFARLTITNASRLFGDRGAEVKAVRDGWAKVGIQV
jgi:Zn-dependent metalloprotease